MVSQREARRQRNREDAQRVQQMRIEEHPSLVKALNKMGNTSQIGSCAGNTYREHLEDEIRKAVRMHARLVKECEKLADQPDSDAWGSEGVEHKRKAARGIIRGLCKALLIYEDSYNKDDKRKLARIEKEFLTEGEDNG